MRDDCLGVDLIGRAEGLSRKRDRMKIGPLRLGFLRVEIKPGASEQIDGLIPLQPAFEKGVGLAGCGPDHIELRRAVGVLDRRPSVGRACCLVHDQHAERALTGGFFVLVGPAPVVGHRFAAELARRRVVRRCFEVGIVDQDNCDLSLEIHALEVVPPALRRLDAVSHEDQRRLVDLNGLNRQKGVDHDIFPVLKRARAV